MERLWLSFGRVQRDAGVQVFGLGIGLYLQVGRGQSNTRVHLRVNVEAEEARVLEQVV